jgi:hypothetical protein
VKMGWCSFVAKGWWSFSWLKGSFWMTLKRSSGMLGTLKMQSSEVWNDFGNILIRLLTLYSFHWFYLCQWSILHKSNVIYKGADFLFSCTHFLILNLHLTFSWVMLAALLLNLQLCLFFLSIFQWLQSGFHISTLIALVMHNMEWMKP